MFNITKINEELQKIINKDERVGYFNVSSTLIEGKVRITLLFHEEKYQNKLYEECVRDIFHTYKNKFNIYKTNHHMSEYLTSIEMTKGDK